MKKTLLSIGAALLFGFGAMAQSNTMVADCDSDNYTSLGTVWYSYASPEASASITPAQGADFTMGTEGDNSFANATGHIDGNVAASNLYPSAGIGFALTATNAVWNNLGQITNADLSALDLTGATGISFKIKSDRPVNFSVMNAVTKQDAGVDFSFLVTPQAEWTTITVTFPGSTITGADGPLTQPSWLTGAADSNPFPTSGNPSPSTWDQTKCVKMQWQVKDAGNAPAADGTPFNFSIDDVTILGLQVALKLELQNAIYAAQGALDYALDPANGIEKTQNEIDTFEAAIVTAQAVMNNPAVSQTEVNDAIGALEAAQLTFEGGETPEICEEEDAINYGEEGPCVFEGEGCTIEGASNYDAAATINDGSCTWTGTKVSLPYNSYTTNSFQVKLNDKLGTWVPKVGEKVTIKMIGQSNWDLEQLQVGIVDIREAADYWGEFGDMVGSTTVTAGEEFTIETEFEVTDLTMVTEAGATVTLAAPNFVIDALTATETWKSTNTVNLFLSTFEVTTPTPSAISTVNAAKVAVKASSIEISSDKAIASVVVTNVIGAQVVNQAVGAASASVSTANLQAGIYYATINFANGTTQVVKFAK